MKLVSFDDVLQEELKDEEFSILYETEKTKNLLARTLVKLRHKYGITQEQLAQRAHTRQPVIARIERGIDSRTPSIDLLFRIAHGLGCELNISFTTSKQNNKAVKTHTRTANQLKHKSLRA